MERYYAERFGSSEYMPAIPRSTAGLKALTLRMLDFTVHDERELLGNTNHLLYICRKVG